MSGEAKQTLTNWLSRMATQDNQCLNSLLQTETCEINGNPANNANIDILNVDKIDYCHVEKWYDDETYHNMKSGIMSTRPVTIHSLNVLIAFVVSLM